MTTFLRFFILALTPLLGVTASLGPSLLFGLTATLVLAASAAFVNLTRNQLRDQGLVWSVLAVAGVLVTLVDLATTLWLPGVRAVWGVYLHLLAFLPLLVLSLEPKASDLATDLAETLKLGLVFTLVLFATALVREGLGQGTLTLIPGAVWTVPGLSSWPLTILTTGAGGFFLAALAVVAYRKLRPRWDQLADQAQAWKAPVEAPPAPVAGPASSPKPEPRPTPEPSPAPPAPETEPLAPLENWGETIESVVTSLADRPEHRRLLVIGSGNGELAYYLAMLCLGLDQGSSRGFSFEVRGVDHFSTRVETALRAVYRDHQIEFVPLAVREQWMTRGQGEERYLWKVGPQPRLHVQFEVADFQKGQVFFAEPAHLIVLNQGIEYVTDEKKALLLGQVCDHLKVGGALVVTGPLKRELLPEGMKRTGTSVFRKA